MVDFIMNLFKDYGISEKLLRGISIVLSLLLIGAISFILKKIAYKIIRMVAHNFNKLNKFKWHSVFVERKVFQRLSHLVPIVIIYALAPTFPKALSWILQKGASIYFILIVISLIDSMLNSINDIYSTYEYSKHRPIKGYLQVIKIVAYVIASIQIIATLMGKNPLLLLSGIGAFSAVLMLVFQDSILGLVASIQLSANDMMRIGDWVEMPSHNVDGSVIEISLNTVKIQNFDRAVTTVPTYAFISNSFKNWRAMTEAGGRRIKRSIYIDISSISFCTEEMLEHFERIEYISDYINIKRKEIRKFNDENYIDDSILTNGRHLTNIGVFRVYIEKYLENHPHINKDMTKMVRQLPPNENGLPIEIYAFTNSTVWNQYENIQSDIFDHILAVVPEFGLRIFQNPSGYDLHYRKIENDTRKNNLKIAGDY